MVSEEFVVLEIMETLPKVIIDALLSGPSEFFDNHIDTSLTQLKCVHYIGNVALNTGYPNMKEDVYIGIMAEENSSFRYSMTTTNRYTLIITNQSAFDTIIKGESIDFFIDYDLSLFQKILNTWTAEEVKLQVIFT